MQLFTDSSFFICLAIAAVPALILGINEKPIKYYGMAASLFFIWMSMGSDLKALLCMIAFIVYEFCLIQVQFRFREAEQDKKWIFYLFIILSIAPLTVVKAALATGIEDGLIGFAGISYMTFKAVQIVIESYDGTITAVKPFEYLYLMLFFPTITSGPIDRSRRFNDDINRVIPKEEYLALAENGIVKILLGMLYKTGIAAVFYYLMKQYGMEHSVVSAVIYMYAYGFNLFFDFAGYSLMAIGAGYILGIKVPDNFNKPFLAKDIQDFWNRWHITLSHWLRDYVFSRITMNLMRSGRKMDKLTIASIALMINMFVMGCWHGLEPQYILYGLYHGVLMTGFEIFRKKSKFYKKHKKEKWFGFISWFITLHLVLVGFFLFSGRLTRGILLILK
ncbi:MAG: D-alanyl-lipoteichoic acid biosynthesis protein DltB [Clostridiales bacterium]|nr:D-alanyl-lipoteichoic acid biosynthesis protein DltB [Clostridiales bacterium]